MIPFWALEPGPLLTTMWVVSLPGSIFCTFSMTRVLLDLDGHRSRMSHFYRELTWRVFVTPVMFARGLMLFVPFFVIVTLIVVWGTPLVFEWGEPELWYLVTGGVLVAMLFATLVLQLVVGLTGRPRLLVHPRVRGLTVPQLETYMGVPIAERRPRIERWREKGRRRGPRV